MHAIDLAKFEILNLRESKGYQSDSQLIEAEVSLFAADDYSLDLADDPAIHVDVVRQSSSAGHAAYPIVQPSTP